MSDFRDQLGSPASYLTLSEGDPVLSGDGERIGRVGEVRADTSVDVFDGLVLATGSLGADKRFVEAELVDEIYVGGVVLTIDAAAAAGLPEVS
jgi:hypothetical protein